MEFICVCHATTLYRKNSILYSRKLDKLWAFLVVNVVLVFIYASSDTAFRKHCCSLRFVLSSRVQAVTPFSNFMALHTLDQCLSLNTVSCCSLICNCTQTELKYTIKHHMFLDLKNVVVAFLYFKSYLPFCYFISVNQDNVQCYTQPYA